MNNNKIENTFIQIYPEKIDIPKFSNNKISKSFIISNNCNIPLILFLTPSDSSYITIINTTIKLKPKSKIKIDFSLRDNIYKNSSKKNPYLKPKKLFIFIKNDLIEEKVEIILSYYSKENNYILTDDINNKNDFEFNNLDNELELYNLNYLNLGNIYSSPQRIINHNFSNKINNIENYEDINNQNIDNREKNFGRNNYLRNKNIPSKKMLNSSGKKIKSPKMKQNKFSGKLIKEKSFRFTFVGTKENMNNYKYQNEILKVQNHKLNNMVNYLQKELMKHRIELNKINNIENSFNNNNNNKYIVNNYNYN